MDPNMTSATENRACRYQVADLTLDVGRRRVTRNGDGIALSTLSFDLLRVLLEASPDVVGYDELAAKVWKRSFVSPENVAQRIMRLRQALSDDAARPRYIEAVRARGYRALPPVERLPPEPASMLAARRRPPRLVIVAGLVGVVALAAAVATVFRLPNTAPAVQERTMRVALPNSVAVLPFQNLSADPEDAFFAAGIHQEIVSQLGTLHDLNVIATTSVRRYTDADRSIQEIARELDVETVMQGAVRYAGDRVRITVQLVEGEAGRHLWSQVYERELADVFAVQADIAANIARALDAEFSSVEQRNLAHVRTHSGAAYAHYLRALDAMRVAQYAVAVDYLNQAVAIDSEFLDAHARKAAIYAWAQVNSDRRGQLTRSSTPPEIAELARLALENAERGIAAESGTAAGVAWAARALTHMFHWRWTEARTAFERAYALSPNDPEIVREYGLFSCREDAFDEGLPLIRRAIELDPNGAVSHGYLAMCSEHAHHEQDALEAWRKAVELSGQAVAYMAYGHAEARSGNFAEAEQALRTAERLDAALASPVLARGYALLGLRDDAMRVFRKYLEQYSEIEDAGSRVRFYLLLGDRERALEWLERAVEKVEQRQPDLGFVSLTPIKANAYGDPVLEEPEFRALRARLGNAE